MNDSAAMNDYAAISDEVTLRLSIRGRVQGVWFRESMRLEAERLGVTGWVRNRLDGSVEAVVQGPRAAVDEIVRWRGAGPKTPACRASKSPKPMEISPVSRRSRVTSLAAVSRPSGRPISPGP